MRLDRRGFLAGAGVGMIACASAARAEDYKITPEKLGDGIWIVRGADEPIEPGNGGAIANITIIDTPAGTVLCDCGPSLRYGIALKKTAEQLTGKPVSSVYVTHLHPDHGMGIAAFDPKIVAALPGTITDIERDGRGFSDAFYRLLNDWMRGTEVVKPGRALTAGVEDHGGRSLRLLALSGHSAADLALLDERTGLLIGGDLFFHNRAPSTPTADLAKWRESLGILAALKHSGAIPGHGPFDPSGTEAITQTRDWIDWLEKTLDDAVANGLDMVEAGELPIPDRFSGFAAARYEFERSIAHFYPAIEAKTLPRIDTAGN